MERAPLKMTARLTLRSTDSRYLRVQSQMGMGRTAPARMAQSCGWYSAPLEKRRAGPTRDLARRQSRHENSGDEVRLTK